MGGLTALCPRSGTAGLSDSDFASGADGQWYGAAVDPLGLMVNTAASLKAMEIGAPELGEPDGGAGILGAELAARIRYH